MDISDRLILTIRRGYVQLSGTRAGEVYLQVSGRGRLSVTHMLIAGIADK